MEQSLGWETRLTVTGYIAPGISLQAYCDHPRITLRGMVDDVAPLYDAHRLCVAPTRFAAGLPRAAAGGKCAAGRAVGLERLGNSHSWGGAMWVSNPRDAATRIWRPSIRHNPGVFARLLSCTYSILRRNHKWRVS